MPRDRNIALAEILNARKNQRKYPGALLGEMDWTEEFLLLGGTAAELLEACDDRLLP
jgi:hypothetical protein